MPYTYIEINPEVLIWAKKRAHLSEEELARKVAVKVERYLQWEAGESKPTLRQLRKLALSLKRPIQLFFLSDIPDEPEVLTEMRRLPGVPIGQESPELTLQVQLIQERREIAINLYDDLNEEPPEIGLKIKSDQNIKTVSESLRKIIGVSIDDQVAWSDPYQAIREWRSALESIGILLFHVPGVLLDEMRGFSLSLQPLPIIGINSRDYPRARIFTIFHELIHILMGEKILHAYHPEWFQIDPSIMVERFCNSVAAAFLIPNNDITPFVKAIGKRNDDVWEDYEIKRLSDRYKVSKAVIIRRLNELGLISEDSYKVLVSTYDSFVPKISKRKGGDPFANKILHMGTLIPQLAFRSYYSNKLTASDLSSLFGFKVKNLGRLEERIFGISYGFGSI